MFDHIYIEEKVGEANNVIDLQEQMYYRFLENTYYLHLLGLGLLLYVVGGFPYLFWGMYENWTCLVKCMKESHTHLNFQLLKCHTNHIMESALGLGRLLLTLDIVR